MNLDSRTAPVPGLEQVASEGARHLHTEYVAPGRSLQMIRQGGWLLDVRERYGPGPDEQQRVQIADFAEFGRTLVIDGQVQLAEAIDPVYTAALVFPAGLLCESAKRWLILGGGDGAAAREALAFAQTREVRVVDLSEAVVRGTQRLIPRFWGQSVRDPRLHVRAVDALQELAAPPGELADVILFDLTDAPPPGAPVPPGVAVDLYTTEAFAAAARHLAPGGVMVVQAQELSAFVWTEHAELLRRIRQSFRHAASYRVFVEMFGYWQSFIVASNAASQWSPVPPDLEQRLHERRKDQGAGLWSADWHCACFSLNPSLVNHFAALSSNPGMYPAGTIPQKLTP